MEHHLCARPYDVVKAMRDAAISKYRALQCKDHWTRRDFTRDSHLTRQTMMLNMELQYRQALDDLAVPKFLFKQLSPEAKWKAVHFFSRQLRDTCDNAPDGVYQYLSEFAHRVETPDIIEIFTVNGYRFDKSGNFIDDQGIGEE